MDRPRWMRTGGCDHAGTRQQGKDATMAGTRAGEGGVDRAADAKFVLQGRRPSVGVCLRRA